MSNFFAGSESPVSTSHYPMLISHYQKDIVDFHIRDLELTPIRSFKVNGHDALLLIWSWQTFLFIGILDLGANRLDDTIHFQFRDLEMTSSRSFKVTFFCGFSKANIDFPMVSHSNHGSISHRLATIHECNR